MIKTSLSTEDQEYKAVNPGNAHDSDEEQLKQEPVISQEEQSKEQEQKEEIKQIAQQQGSPPQKKQPQTPPQVKLVEINNDYQELEVKVKWQDRVRVTQPCKFSKKNTIEINEPVLFTMEKNNPKHGRGFFQSLFSSDYRYIYFLDGYLIMLHMRNDQILVKSHTELSRLYKIIVKTNSIILCFINEQMDLRMAPKVKQYDFLKGIEQKGKLLMKLRGELNKIGLEYEIRK